MSADSACPSLETAFTQGLPARSVEDDVDRWLSLVEEWLGINATPRRARPLSAEGSAAYDQALEALLHEGQQLQSLGQVFPLLRGLSPESLASVKAAAERLGQALAQTQEA